MATRKNRSAALLLLSLLSLLAGCFAPPAPAAPATARPAIATPLTPALVRAADGFPWWNDTVFYQIFVRSFADSTTGPLANDGIGDLEGISEKLGYLQELGVRGVWLTPLMASPSYHGYDVTDYRKVKTEYGTNDDFKRLMAEAHRHGIRIIIDLPINHTSNQHPWFQAAAKPDSPYRDWYTWADQPGDYKGPWGQQVWHRLGDKWYYGIFWEGMPDLNFRNPQVTEEVNQIARWWLTEMGVDGFRLDAARYFVEDGRRQASTPGTLEWLRNFQQIYKAAAPSAVTIGEIWTSTDEIGQYVPKSVDLAFEFDLAQSIIRSINRDDPAQFLAALGRTLATYPPGQFAPFLTNHDQNRVMSEFTGDVSQAKLAATVLLTLPGVPFIYYGEEIGMTGLKPDEMLRTPMQWTPGENAGFSAHAPWQPVNKGFEAMNVQTQRADPQSLLNWYRTLIILRNSRASLRVGNVTAVASDNERVAAFLRQHEGETSLLLYNFSSKPISSYGLTLDKSDLRGAVKAGELLQNARVTPPTLNAQGGFGVGESTGPYKPLPELAPRSGYVVDLRP